MDDRQTDRQVYLINYHLVSCPKRRKQVLVCKTAERLKDIIQHFAKELEVDVFALD